MEQSVKIYRQNKSDENKQKSKSKESTGSNTAFKKQRDNSGDPLNSGLSNKDGRKNKQIENNGDQYLDSAALSASRIAGPAGGSSEKGLSSSNGQANQPNTGSAVTRHLSNKSDTNLNGQSAATSNNGGASTALNINRTGQNRQASEGRKKRKNSDKQRKNSNNRRGENKDVMEKNQNGMLIPPIDNGATSMPTQSLASVPSHQRSHSRGAVQSQNSQIQAQAINIDNMGGTHKEVNFLPSQFFDQASFNPFTSNLSQGSQQSTFNMAMAGSAGFPFHGQNGPYNQQAPQVHFIAKKQQFIAQISPDQLMSDKRPYTAQSLNGLSASTKRAGSVYAGAIVNKGNNYNLANAAFANQPVYFGNIGARTHTNGFSFHPPGGGGPLSKYSNSIYGEEYKPKVAGKDILKALGQSNGFNSDPYHSIMSSGLPSSLTHSGRPQKGKVAGNRHQAKEKEQLYDETIKMKMLNNSLREDHVKLKTKIKILENELSRKEKTIEELFSHNQLIQNNQKGNNNQNQNLMPMAQTAQKYQQETFLVMSLKKQIRELKYEVLKRDEELEVLRKNIKNTRTKELEQEISTYHMECMRLRQITEELIKEGQNHPLHQNAFMDRMNQLQMELNQKDMIIKQLSDSLSKLESASSVTAINNNQNSQLAGVRSQDSQSFETHVADNSQAKSVERKSQISNIQKDFQKELTKIRKQLREKEKELVKLRNEMSQIKKENTDKAKSDNQQTKDVEVQLKNLKEKLRDQKNENKRKDERLVDSEQRIRKLEETVKQNQDLIKNVENNNKTLKNQLRAAKHQATVNTSTTNASNFSQTSAQTQKEAAVQVKEMKEQVIATSVPDNAEKVKPNAPKEEMFALTLIAQREKLCRDDLTAMMLAGEESLRILIREPSDQLIDFIKANLNDEDTLLSAIPRFEMPKADFEAQVLREMRIVLRDNIEKIVKHSEKELIEFQEFEKFYLALDNFEYPHKDKLLEFIKYFFLDHIITDKKIMMNYLAFKEHMLSRRAIEETTPKSRNTDNHLKSRKKSQESSNGGMDESVKKMLLGGGSEEDKLADEERMLDIAEQCFMRIADLLHIIQKTVRQVFLRYSQPEAFKNGSILELMSPTGFLEGIRDIGFDDVTELEAACLMKVLAKPELDNAIILNEFVLIMENFGIPAISEEEEYENDYIPDSDEEKDKDKENEEGDEQQKEGDDGEKDKKSEMDDRHKQFAEKKSQKQKNPINIKFSEIEEKGLKILKKLARFLLERYMHPREFFGPTIKKETFGKKNCKVEIIKLHDFYLRLKLASIRKKLKENVSLNLFLAIDGEKFPGFIQVKRMIKALEVVAEGEQELMIKEQEEKDKAEKERIQKLIDDRAAQGLPPYTEEELDVIKMPEQEKKKKAAVEKKKLEEPAKGGMNEILKIGGQKKSPKTSEKNKFASHLGVHMELNTIEEDLHETQTSHYSQHLKEGDGSERGSRHLSTSNNFKGNELEDSNNLSRRSENAAARQSLPLGVSVNSGDYSGGSHSSTKKGNKIAHELEVNDMDICINDFKQNHRKSQQSIIKEENHEEETTPAVISSRKIDIDEQEKLMKDELDAEVEQKFEKLTEGKGGYCHDEAPDGENDDDYEDDEEFNNHDLKEDTIKTDQVEQIVENENMRLDRLDNVADIEEYSYKDEETKSDNQKIKDQDSVEEEDDYEF